MLGELVLSIGPLITLNACQTWFLFCKVWSNFMGTPEFHLPTASWFLCVYGVSGLRHAQNWPCRHLFHRFPDSLPCSFHHLPGVSGFSEGWWLFLKHIRTSYASSTNTSIGLWGANKASLLPLRDVIILPDWLVLEPQCICNILIIYSHNLFNCISISDWLTVYFAIGPNTVLLHFTHVWFSHMSAINRQLDVEVALFHCTVKPSSFISHDYELLNNEVVSTRPTAKNSTVYYSP